MRGILPCCIVDGLLMLDLAMWWIGRKWRKRNGRGGGHMEGKTRDVHDSHDINLSWCVFFLSVVQIVDGFVPSCLYFLNEPTPLYFPLLNIAHTNRVLPKDQTKSPYAYRELPHFLYQTPSPRDHLLLPRSPSTHIDETPPLPFSHSI